MTDAPTAVTPRTELKNLVVVTGHAIYLAKYGTPLEDRDWYLQAYEYGEPPLLIEHIHRGVEIAAADPSALLVFSGGQSRAGAGPRSEAQGYWHLAERFRWWDRDGVAARATTEEYARDSFENLLFSICRFWEWTGRHPEHIHVLSWEFKRGRFDLIRAALRIPEGSYTFVGVNEPPDPEAARAGEAKTLAAIRLDPYGTGPELGPKREERNPFHRTAPYTLSCPPYAELLAHRGPDLFTGDLPWSS